MENYLSELYERDLLKLKQEIVNFKNEENIWLNTAGVTNSAGTLVLHLLGNLNFTIGATIGGTGYVRDREAEFSLNGISREKLISDIEKTIEVIKFSLENVEQSKLDETYPLGNFGTKSTAFYLSTFYGHLNYHLGQVNYLRRVLESGL